MACGRRFRVLNIVDDVTRECLQVVPDTSISGRRAVRELAYRAIRACGEVPESGRAAMLLLAEYFPGRHNGHGQGVFYGLSSGIGGVVGALLSGQLWHFGGQLAFAVSGFVALLAFAVAWYWLLRVPPAATRPA